MPVLEEGKAFKSLHELEEFIKNVESDQYIQLYKRDSKKISTMLKSCPKKCNNANRDLIYYLLTYACYKGGQNFKSRGEGIRKCSTFRDDCPMRLTFRLSPDGQKLVLTKVDNVHNHDLDKTMFSLLPKQRRLNTDEKKEVLRLKKLKCSKTLLKDYMQNKTGKKLSLSDISNVRSTSTKDDLAEVLEYLEGQPESHVHAVTDAENVLQGIFFQNQQMADYFCTYPELLVIDSTFKVTKSNTRLYMFLAADGNGEWLVVGSFITHNENPDFIVCMIRVFKLQNPSWVRTQTIFTDKVSTERKLVSQEFPHAKVRYCPYNISKVFESGLTKGITYSDRDTVLRVFKKLSSSKNSEQYKKNYDSLVDIDLPAVIRYFNENWHNCQEEWVFYREKEGFLYDIPNTHQLHLFMQKIRPLYSLHINHQDFYKDLLRFLETTHNERRQKAVQMMYRNKSTSIAPNSAEDQYFRQLTPFAFKFVKKSIEDSQSMKLVEYDKIYFVDGTKMTVDAEQCQCDFYKHTTIPCQHIFKYRSIKNMELYSENIVPRRFKRQLYLENYRSKENTADKKIKVETLEVKGVDEVSLDGGDNDNMEVTVDNDDEDHQMITRHQKRTRALAICQQLANVMAEMDTQSFYQRYSKLEKLIQTWSSSKSDAVGDEDL
ncbi:unnamed protein product [Acanthoscelides obtectus]|uniref:SWIM-type domain-containing protein n=1 Tax=Acanthoscelides obtectus TaxID=200917 RepID=A0A9P0KBA1_ACAOB|nr:unnamed protein product [Acanthoscelides obtectus]CAK1653189.1 Zinc finger SWIM domain-containing protein 3 [Acanthoscelides obtectus]